MKRKEMEEVEGREREKKRWMTRRKKWEKDVEGKERARRRKTEDREVKKGG